MPNFGSSKNGFWFVQQSSPGANVNTPPTTCTNTIRSAKSKRILINIDYGVKTITDKKGIYYLRYKQERYKTTKLPSIEAYANFIKDLAIELGYIPDILVSYNYAELSSISSKLTSTDYYCQIWNIDHYGYFDTSPGKNIYKTYLQGGGAICFIRENRFSDFFNGNWGAVDFIANTAGGGNARIYTAGGTDRTQRYPLVSPTSGMTQYSTLQEEFRLYNNTFPKYNEHIAISQQSADIAGATGSFNTTTYINLVRNDLNPRLPGFIPGIHLDFNWANSFGSYGTGTPMVTTSEGGHSFVTTGNPSQFQETSRFTKESIPAGIAAVMWKTGSLSEAPCGSIVCVLDSTFLNQNDYYYPDSAGIYRGGYHPFLTCNLILALDFK